MVEKQPDEDFSRCTAVITDDKWTISEGGKITARVAFILDPTKKPRTIDLVDLKTKSCIGGIYSFTGDTLTICGRSPDAGGRPTEFGTQRDSGLVQFVWKRAKPADQADSFIKETAQALATTQTPKADRWPLHMEWLLPGFAITTGSSVTPLR
jgi:uncharacterized protein (TIGR03067 family)